MNRLVSRFGKVPVRSPVKLLPQDVRLASPGFRVTKTWRPAGFRLAPHSHELTNISVCIAGTFEETLRGTWRRVTTASLICRPGGEPHANNYTSEASRAVIFEVSNQTLAAVSTFSPVLRQPVWCNSADVVALASRVRSHFDPNDALAPLALEALAYELIAVAAAAGTTRKTDCAKWLARARDLIDAHFRRSLTLDEIAREAGVHPAHLARAFRQRFGRSIGEYVRALRASHAERLLRKPDMPLAEIAAAAGFYDQSHFTRVFKRSFGISPAKYRRTVLGSARAR